MTTTTRALAREHAARVGAAHMHHARARRSLVPKWRPCRIPDGVLAGLRRRRRPGPTRRASGAERRAREAARPRPSAPG